METIGVRGQHVSATARGRCSRPPALRTRRRRSGGDEGSKDVSTPCEEASTASPGLRSSAQIGLCGAKGRRSWKFFFDRRKAHPAPAPNPPRPSGKDAPDLRELRRVKKNTCFPLPIAERLIASLPSRKSCGVREARAASRSGRAFRKKIARGC
jgi:hypothetical protein